MFRIKKSNNIIQYNKKLISKILIFCFITVSFALLVGSANAYERPVFKDGLTDKWHPGNFCIPCHYTLTETEKARAISNGCKCHTYKPKGVESGYKIDMTRIFDIHKDLVCIRCHVGIKNETNVTAPDFHRVMSKVACLNCHTFENGTYQKPQKRKCSECHGGDPHVVHDKRLEKMCVACHGEFGEKYVNRTIEPSEKMRSPSTLNTTLNKSEETIKEFTTIGQLISKIIQSILQIIR